MPEISLPKNRANFVLLCELTITKKQFQILIIKYCQYFRILYEGKEQSYFKMEYSYT